MAACKCCWGMGPRCAGVHLTDRGTVLPLTRAKKKVSGQNRILGLLSRITILTPPLHPTDRGTVLPLTRATQLPIYALNVPLRSTIHREQQNDTSVTKLLQQKLIVACKFGSGMARSFVGLYTPRDK